jgi:DNA-binding transcriptional MerR regulator
VAEFADMSGVTVRTLQYYDRIGLLKPTATTEGGHRLYVRGDLVRLQQILTLKWMGFSLDDIKAILESPTYDLHESLVIQKAAVEAQLARLREASAALDVAIDAAQALSEDDVDSETVSAIIRAVLAQNENEWVRRYYNDEAWLAIQTRQLSFTPDDQAKAEREWHAIYTAFDAVRDQPPDSDAAQEIAAKMMALGLQFTKGDPQIEAGLRQFVHDAGDGKLPPELKHYAPFAGVDDDLRRFIQFAMEIYQERAKK